MSVADTRPSVAVAVRGLSVAVGWEVARREITEGFILENYVAGREGIELPLLWQVLFQEGVRANHLLFSREEVESFDFTSPDRMSEDEQEILEEAASKLFLAPDLASMKAAIAHCSPTIRKQLFVLYQSFLSALSQLLKQSLN